MKRIVFAIITACIFFIAQEGAAQVYPDWEGYPPMFSMNDVIVFKGNVYGVCDAGFFCYNPKTQDYELYYKNHGLEAKEALTVAATSKYLFIGFKTDGLMRFDTEKKIFEPILFPEYVSGDVVNTLSINNIYALNDSILFIAHSHGVDRLDLSNEEIRSFTKLSYGIEEDTPVNKIKVFKGKIWACTPTGLAWADIDNPNLEAEENWDSYSFPAGVNCIFNYVDSIEDIIFVGTDGSGIYKFDSEQKTKTATLVSKSRIYDLVEANGTFYAAAYEGLYEKSAESWFFSSNINQLNAMFPGNGDSVWVATSLNGLQCFNKNGLVSIPPINMPNSYTFRDIEITGKNSVWAATSYRDKGGLVERFSDSVWTHFDENDRLPTNSTTVAMLNDSRGVLWGATFGNGLYLLDDMGTIDKDDDSVTRIDPDMKIILPIPNTTSFVVCPDIAEDVHGNVWVAGWDVGVYVLEGKTPINEYKNTRFTFDNSNTDHIITNLFPDSDGWVWLGTWDTGLIALYTGDDPFSTSDDKVVYVPSQDLLSMRVQAIRADKEGMVWVGTDAGLNRIRKESGYTLDVENMNSIFSGTAVDIRALEVDRFNNKWVGTSNGLIQINAKNELAAHYTVENSGLLSNEILSLKYDSVTDVLWIGTDFGLNKFSPLYHASGETEKRTHVYPNPFEIWGYNSTAVFNDLKKQKPVRIFTFSGELLNELVPSIDDGSGSSSITWNGTNYKGEYVGSGVYYFTGTDSMGRSFKEKMIVIRR